MFPHLLSLGYYSKLVRTWRGFVDVATAMQHPRHAVLLVATCYGSLLRSGVIPALPRRRHYARIFMSDCMHARNSRGSITPGCIDGKMKLLPLPVGIRERYNMPSPVPRASK